VASQVQIFQREVRHSWLGPYDIDNVYENTTIKLQIIDGEINPLMENGENI